ncbi:hypothetical protein BH11CYA1_BH11CYA1_24600 [soil metagenome]
MHHNSNKSRSRRGSGLIEAILAATVLVPIALFLLDLTVMIIANSMNDTAAKNAARAAANQPEGGAAHAAAVKALATFQASSIVKSLTISEFDYPAQGVGSVSVVTVMEVKLPVPVPGFSGYTFKAGDVEPIVGSTIAQ